VDNWSVGNAMPIPSQSVTAMARGMDNPGAGPRWLAKARYESAF